MKGIAPAEQRAIDEAAAWYVDELSQMGGSAHLNAGFMSATVRAATGLNTHLNQRLAFAFSSEMVKNPPRYKQLMEYAGRVVKETVEANALARAALYQKRPDKPGDATLKTYLQGLEALLRVARGEDGALRSLDGAELDKGKDFARRLWATLRNARIFDFSPDDYVSIHRATDLYTTEKIAKLNWQAYGEGVEPNEEETKRFVASINEAGAKVPFPDPLPFDACYIGLGDGVALTENQWAARTVGMEPRSVAGAALLGYVIWTGPTGGWVVEIVQVVEPNDNYMLPNVLCMDGFWYQPTLNMAPWITTHLIAVINDHRKLIVETKPSASQRHDWGKKGKKLKIQGLVPRPYYVVRMEKALIEETGKKTRENLSKISRELAYRHDRRGHERCYIRRGKLPLEPKDQKKLEDAEYRIWTINEPDSTAYRQLMERGQPPKAPDEWIAILTRWVDQTIVGPEDKPYVPAIRLPALPAK